MSLVYMCTLGQRPEAITLALDKLSQQHSYDEVVVLHTEPNFSAIAEAYAKVMTVLRQDYPEIETFRGHQLCYENGDPIIDIQDAHSAAAYHLSLLHVLIDYKRQGWTIHLMVAGGRKAMSIYATLAATLILQEPDRVLSVISPPEVIHRTDTFHVSETMQECIYVVNLPFLASRLLPSYVHDLLDEDISDRSTIGQKLWSQLTKKEQALAGILERNPDISNRELASLVQRDLSTIENQLGSIYKKLGQYYDLSDRKHKRYRLLEVLRQRENEKYSTKID